MIEFKLTEDQRRVAKAAAQDDSHPVLHCVHIKKGVIEAANGFMFVQKTIDYDGDKDILLDIDDIAPHKGKKVDYAVFEDGTVKATGKYTFLLYRKEGKFPNIDRMYPQTMPVFEIGLGAPMLKVLLDSLDKDAEGIKFTFYGATLPVKFETSQYDTKGLIMPTV